MHSYDKKNILKGDKYELINAFKQYADFKGRARRKEFWYFVLFNIIVSFILGFVDGILGLADKQSGIGLLGGLYLLAVLIPSLAIEVRRLHDTNRSGWFILIAFIPIIGGFILLYFLVQDSNPSENKYGPNPKL